MAFGNEALLRPEREQTWREFAAAVGGTYRAGDFWEPEAIVAARGPWRIVLRPDSSASLPITRAETNLTLPTGLRLVYGQGEFAPSSSFDLLDVPDAAGFMRASHAARARNLMGDPAVQALLALERHVALRIARHDLRLVVAGQVHDHARLRRLLAATAGLLDGFCAQAGSLRDRAEP